MLKLTTKFVLWFGIIAGTLIASPVLAQGTISPVWQYCLGAEGVSAERFTSCRNLSSQSACQADLNQTLTAARTVSIDGQERNLVVSKQCTTQLEPGTEQIPVGQSTITNGTTGGQTGQLSIRPNPPSDDFGLECFSLEEGVRVSHCFALIGYVFYVPAVWIVTVSGYIFDGLLAFSLSGDVIGNQSFVVDGWTAVRNISNLVFIFFLLYIAIKTILGLGDWKKSVVPVIIVALLINFSLFFTKIVIDASNILAYQFYNNIGAPDATPIISESTIGFQARSISQHIVGDINPQQLAQVSTYQGWEGLGGDAASLFFFFIAAATILLVIAYVLFKAAFLMLGRLIAFWILMMFSPLAFLGFAFPQAQKITGEWTKKLTDQALVAPVFLFFLYLISIIVASGVTNIQMGESATDVIMVLTMIVLKTAVFVALMMYALKTTKDLSGEFGKSVTEYVGKAAGFTLAGAAFAGRHTIGRAASTLADENTERGKKFRDWASKSRFGEMTFRATKDLGGATFDARNTKLGKTLDLDLGKGGGKGGYQKILDNQVKDRKEFAKELAKGRDGEEADKIKEQYATRITSPTAQAFGVDLRDPETLFTKTARKNKDAAKQIMKDVDKSRNARNIKENRKTLAAGEAELKTLTQEHKTLAEEDASIAVRQRRATGQATQADKDLEAKVIAKKARIDELEKKNEDLRKRIKQGEDEVGKKKLKDAVDAVTKDEQESKPKEESSDEKKGEEK